jgi:hypothetical protein
VLTEGVLFAPISIVRGGRTSDPPPSQHGNFLPGASHPSPHGASGRYRRERLKAGEVLRSLVQRIVLTPEKGELKIELIGDWPTS